MIVGRLGAFVPLLVAEVLLLPSAALSDDPSADFVVTQQVYDGDWNPIEELPELLIGHRVHFSYYVRNNGPDLAQFTFRFSLSEDVNAYYDPAHIAWSRYGDDRCDHEMTPLGGTITCPGGSELFFEAAVEGNAPRPLTVSAAVVGAVIDPETSNNSSTWGTTVNCSIVGTSADDVLSGTEDIDSVCGRDGNDHLIAVGSDDELFGQGGDDTFSGTRGNTWGKGVGGPGFDTVTYENATYRIIICRETAIYSTNLSSWAPTGLVDVERFIGSRFGDMMEGTGGTDILLGKAGADRLVGLHGRDQLKGGAGRDRFITRDTVGDEIRGGYGYDRVRADPRDQVFSARRVSTDPFFNPCDG